MEVWKKKICLIGADGTGKTSIIIRYTQNTFSNSYLMTLGCDFYELNFKKNLPENKKTELSLLENRKTKMKLFVWDIASQKNFESMRSYYLQYTNLVVIVVDVNRRNPENFIDPWIKDVHESASEDCPYVIVLNKSDLVDEKTMKNIITDIGSRYKNIKIFHTSAKTGENINELFEYVADFLFKEISN